MIKYRAGAGFLSLAMACSLIMPVSAEDYSDTETWYAKCSQAQTSQSGVKACQGFQEYQKNRKQNLQDSINSYNSSIRIGIIIPFPPANQDAFGSSYSLGQLSELYKTTGLLELQKRLIDTYDNDTQRALNRFLVSAHLNLDTDYNFPSSSVAVNSRNTTTISMQNNGVHPDTTGNAQIADMYAGIIKYFG